MNAYFILFIILLIHLNEFPLNSFNITNILLVAGYVFITY